MRINKEDLGTQGYIHYMIDNEWIILAAISNNLLHKSSIPCTTFSLSSVSLTLEPVHVVYLKPANATAIKLKWIGNPYYPTKVQYRSFFNETGALMAQYTILIPINVMSFEINVDDSVPGYLHTFSLQFVKSLAETLVTTISFTFGKSVYITNYDLSTALFCR